MIAPLVNFQYHRTSTSSTMTTPPCCPQKNGCGGRAYRLERATDAPLESSSVSDTFVVAYSAAICVDAISTFALVLRVMPIGTSTLNRSPSGIPICRAVSSMTASGRRTGIAVAPAVM